MANAVPIVNLGMLYMNNFQLSNDATTPNTILDVAAGQCRDSANVYDIVGEAGSINFGGTGINGLDTGTITASKLYYIYVVSDPVNANATGYLASLSATPLIPNGYSVYRLIGYWASDASSNLLAGYVAGNNNLRKFKYDAPQATAVTAGNATAYTAAALTNLVPILDNMPVSIAFAFTPGAASRVLNMTPGNAVGDAVTITGQVTSVIVSGNAEVLAKVTSSVPEIDYKVSNSGDAVAIKVAGFEYFL